MRYFVIFLLLGTFADLKAQPLGGAACSHGRIQQWPSWAALRYQTGSPDHRARMAKYDVHFYHLRVQLDTLSATVAGHTTIHAHVRAPLDTFAFELHPSLTIDSLFVNGVRRTALVTHGSERDVPLSSAISPGTPLTVDIHYHGTAQEGLFNRRSRNWGRWVTFSLTEPDEADGWFPVKQELDDKADSVQVDITVPLGCKAGSNGLLMGVDTQGGHHTFRWKSRYPIAYYLISVSAADYVDYSFTATLPDGTALPVVNYVYPNALGFFKDEIDTTAALLRLFSGRFGRYPFWREKYGHCMAPFSGGMEHQTMTTQGYFALPLTAHELAHQWFGDYVTCATWNDLWLNEGFASYGEILTFEAFEGPAFARQAMAQWHIDIMQSTDGSVYIPDPDVGNVRRLFDYRLTYLKGAAVVHMLRYLLGDSLFFTGLRTYLQRFAFGTATTDSLRHVLESLSGVALDSFFRQWVYGEGFPIYTLRWRQSADTLYVFVDQQTAHPSVPRFDIPVPIRYVDAAGAHDVRIPSDTLVAFAVTGTVQQLRVDPDHWIPDQSYVVHDPAVGWGPAAHRLPIRLFRSDPTEWTIVTPEPAVIRLIDARGALVRTTALPPGQHSFSVADLPSGPWLIQAITATGRSRTVRWIR